MEQERWKDIEGYDGLYQISDYGRIKSFNGGWGKRKTGKLLSLSKSNNGYYSVGLHLSGIGKTIHISRLVAKYFISNPENKPEVNHIDGIKINNHYTNLEWCNRSHNIKHSYDKLGRVHARGMLGRTGKLNKLTRPIYIPSKKTTVYGAPEAACLLGCSVSHIDKILLGGNVAFGANSCTYDLTI